MKTALILLSILGMACAFSMKNFHRRVKAEDSEENGVFKYRPRYFLYKHAYFYPSLKRFPVQDPWFSLLSRRQIGGSDSSEENGDGDSSDEEGEEETSNEEENNEDSEGNEDEEAEAENTTLSGVTAVYGAETTAGTGTIGLAALQLPKKAGDAESKAAKKKESDEEEEEEEENENEEAEVDENEQVVNGTSTNSTEVDGGNGSSGGDNEEGEEQSVTEAGAEGTTAGREQISDGPKTADPLNGFQHTTPPPEAYGITSPPFRRTTTVEYGGEYEQTGNNEYSTDYQIYDNENGEPRGDNYRAYEDEYSYYKGRGYEGYEGQDYYYHQ